MPAYKKQGGVWNAAQRIYVRDADTYKPADEVWVKYAGVWRLSHAYDVTPPINPILVADLVETEYWEDGAKKTGRYIKVGVSLNAPDPGLRRIRVLTTYGGKAPTTQYGGNFTAQPGDENPNEPWSEFYFNGYENVNRNPIQLHLKRWPRNATQSQTMPQGPVYFAAWAEDSFGNWSGGTFVTVNVPPRVNVVGGGTAAKEARFGVTNTGVFSGGQFSYGRPTQAKGPVRRGLFFYGGAIKDDIGKSGKAKIRKAQIRLERRDDGGAAQANVYLAYHNYGQPQAFAADPKWGTPVKLGKISKGESKWFDIPNSWYDDIVGDRVKGFILLQKDPAKSDAQANDFSVMNAKNDSTRTGELHVVWTE